MGDIASKLQLLALATKFKVTTISESPGRT